MGLTGVIKIGARRLLLKSYFDLADTAYWTSMFVKISLTLMPLYETKPEQDIHICI